MFTEQPTKQVFGLSQVLQLRCVQWANSNKQVWQLQKSSTVNAKNYLLFKNYPTQTSTVSTFDQLVMYRQTISSKKGEGQGEHTDAVLVVVDALVLVLLLLLLLLFIY